MSKPLDFFFNLGEKATRGDPKRKADFDYYLMWIMFLAFFSILISNLMNFIHIVKVDFWTSLKYLGWTGVMLAILWFQYYSLRQIRITRIMTHQFENKEENQIQEEVNSLDIEDVDEMLNGFENRELKGGKE